MPMIDVYAATCTFSDKHTLAHDLAARDAPVNETLIRPTQQKRWPILAAEQHNW